MSARLRAGRLRRAVARALVAAGLTLGGAIALGCSTMRASVDIAAPPDRVWAIVSDIGRYREWNPFLPEASGCVAAGSALNPKRPLPSVFARSS